MPEISLIVMLAITVVSAIVIFKVAKGVIQALLLASTVLSILTAVGGGLVVKDALEFKDNLQANNSMILLSGNEWARLTAGITIKGQAGGQAAGGKGGNTEALTMAELEKLSPLFAKKDYDAMLGKNYKLIIIKESSVTGSLPTLPDSINKEDITKQLEGSNEERAAALAALLSLRINQDPMFIISEYKKGNIIVYPETIAFKAIKLIPLSLFKGVAEKALQQAKGAAAQAVQER